jgi:predicted patatin/cPLA2 family phospholipase
MSAVPADHPVIAALRDRPADARVALVVEGGGMRGAVTGGMAQAVEELGLTPSFDAVYGTSAGALNAMWLTAGRAAAGNVGWGEPALVGDLIEPRRALRGGRIVDIRTLVEDHYEQLSPGVFAAALAAPATLHPMATEVRTGAAEDLHPTLTDPAALRRALIASSNLPILAGPPVRVGEQRYLDGGLTAAIPIRRALEDGATHILVLRSRRLGDVTQPPSRVAGRLVGALLGRSSAAIAAAYLGRAVAEGRDEALLAAHDADPTRTPAVLSVRTLPEAPVPSRLERDLGVIREALEAGRRAARDALAAARPAA